MVVTRVEPPPDVSAAPIDAPARRRRPRQAAVAVLGACAGAAGATLGATDGFTVAEGIRVALLTTWALAASTLVTMRVHVRIGLLLSVGALLGGVSILSDGVLVRGAEALTEDLATAIRAWALALVPAVALHVVLALPDGVLGRTGRRVAAGMAYALGALLGLVVWLERPSVPSGLVVAVAVVGFALVAPASHQRYQASRGLVRQRLQWLGLGVAVFAEAVLVLLALTILIDWPQEFGLFVAAVSVVLPLTFWIWSSRGLVGRIDRVLTHAVSLTGLTGVVVGVYLVVILGLGRSPTQAERDVLLLSMFAAGLSVLVFAPSRDRLEEWANRLVYGERRAPDEALETFGSRMTRALPLDELLLQLAESLSKSMSLKASEVWTGADGSLERAASVPDRDAAVLSLGAKERPVVARAGVSGTAWASVWLPSLVADRDGGPLRIAPVTHAGEVLGLMVVERRLGDDEFSEEDERVLTELGRQLGLALHNSQLDSALQESLDQVRRQAKELQASRARIVAAGDAERRKIERNLHDGAQQHLVALAVKLRLIQQIADGDLEAAKAMLEEARAEAQETVEELRTLAHGIYPPLLMDRGLPEALQAAAGRALLPTTVSADGVGRYPQEIEAAVYFCCLEALQNAGKHAGAGATATVTVEERDGALRFEVRDDGVGFAWSSASAHGAGFVNMTDRVGANGGTVSVTSAPGQGTRIAGEIPVSGADRES